MNIISFIQDFCGRFFYGNSTYQKAKISCATQAQAIPAPIVEKMQIQSPPMQYLLYIPPSKPLASRAISHSAPKQISVQIPVKTPHVTSDASHKKSNIQAQDSLSQSLQNQIQQLESEKEEILAKIAIKRSEETSERSICSSSELTCSHNTKKLADLDKLNERLEKVSDFCNQEMFDILMLSMKGSKALNERLTKLRNETPLIEDETLLCENVEHIIILENALEALQQLEAKFQDMQKSAQQSAPSSQNQEETHINSLLEKIDGLNKQKQFLEECKLSLPDHAAYDVNELQELMQLFENDGKELSQKTKEARQQLNKAENFADTMTNHLLDYVEIFKDHFQKLQHQARIVELPTPTPLQSITTRIQPQAFTITPAPVPLQAILTPAKAEKFTAHDLVAAAADISKALNNLIEATSQ